MRLSFMTRLLTASRCLRDLNTTQEKNTVSPARCLTARGNEVRLPHFTSSAIASRYSSAPCSRIRRPIVLACRRQAASFFFCTGVTKPSTYAMRFSFEECLQLVERAGPAALVVVAHLLVEELLVAEVEVGPAVDRLENDGHLRLAVGSAV